MTQPVLGLVFLSLTQDSIKLRQHRRHLETYGHHQIMVLHGQQEEALEHIATFLYHLQGNIKPWLLLTARYLRLRIME